MCNIFKHKKAFLRNCCDVFLCRINVFTGKLIAVSQLKHSAILPNGCAFNPNQSLMQMRGLFDKLTGLEAGNYLLTKEVKEEKLVIYKSTPAKSGSFDLHFFYNGVLNVEQKEKPHVLIPIDTEAYLPYHITLHKVPGLFEPIYDRDHNKRAGPSPAKKKIIKRRKKKWTFFNCVNFIPYL